MTRGGCNTSPGTAENGRLPDDTDWRSLADPAATTVVYMPKRTLAELAERAIAGGLPADTPAVAVAAATRPDEKIVAGTVADIGEKLAAADADRTGAGVLRAGVPRGGECAWPIPVRSREGGNLAARLHARCRCSWVPAFAGTNGNAKPHS